jgi:hypothetical protein
MRKRIVDKGNTRDQMTMANRTLKIINGISPVKSVTRVSASLTNEQQNKTSRNLQSD